MKKSLLALAVLGTFAIAAQAQTNVSIGGVVQANLKSYSIGSSARNTSNEIRIDDDYDSRFWLTGSEDLGGGNSAIFYVENRLNVDVGSAQGTANGLTNGDSWLGLKGSWGQVTLGKHSLMGTAGLATEYVNAAGGAGHASFSSMPGSMLATLSILDQAGGAYIDGASRTFNSIRYVSPNMSGFVGTVAISTANASNEGQAPAAVGGASNYGDGRLYYLQGTYANGPLFLNLAYRNNQVEGRPAAGIDDRQIRLSGHYVLPMGLKIGLQLDRATRQNVGSATVPSVSNSRTAWELPISYQLGQGAIMGSYTRAGDYGSVSNSGAKLFTLGYDYALSKRTNVGVFYSKLSNDTNGAYQPFLAGTSFTGSGLLAGESAQTFALAVKHVF
jgi:predicted porin